MKNISILFLILTLPAIAAQKLQQATASAAQKLEHLGQPAAARRVRMLGGHIAFVPQQPKPTPTLTQSFGKQCDLSQVPFVKQCCLQEDVIYFNGGIFDKAWFS